VSPPVELEAGYSTAQEDLFVLETRCAKQRESVIGSFQSGIGELYIIAAEELMPLRNGPALMERADLQISQQAFDNEAAWWRFWIPLSRISPGSGKLRLERSEHFSGQFIPIKMVPQLKQKGNCLKRCSKINSDAFSFIFWRIFDREFETAIITSTTSLIIVIPDESFVIPAEDLDILIRRKFSMSLQSGCLSLFVHKNLIFSVNQYGVVACLQVDFGSLSAVQIEMKNPV
jgi:hypothetical protein